MIHAPGIPTINLDDFDFWMHTIQHPHNSLADGFKTITPKIAPFRTFYIGTLTTSLDCVKVIYSTLQALVTTAS
jgi:hypothetical protein